MVVVRVVLVLVRQLIHRDPDELIDLGMLPILSF